MSFTSFILGFTIVFAAVSSESLLVIVGLASVGLTLMGAGVATMDDDPTY